MTRFYRLCDYDFVTTKGWIWTKCCREDKIMLCFVFTFFGQKGILPWPLFFFNDAVGHKLRVGLILYVSLSVIKYVIGLWSSIKYFCYFSLARRSTFCLHISVSLSVTPLNGSNDLHCGTWRTSNATGHLFSNHKHESTMTWIYGGDWKVSWTFVLSLECGNLDYKAKWKDPRFLLCSLHY